MSSPSPNISMLTAAYFSHLAVSGNLKPGLEILLQVSGEILSPSQIELKKKYLERFGAVETHGEDLDFVSDLIRVYENYWRSVLSQRLAFATAENRLLSHLKDVFLHHAPRSLPNLELPIDRIENLVAIELKKQGFKSLMGRTKPHRELMIWKSESVRDFEVDLGDEKLTLPVHMMSDFLVSGWLSFATFGERKTGGWAANQALHCVASVYDLESEKFRVSFLAHEARHISDFRKFPKLNSIDFEYRAKLTELSLARETTLEILDRIKNEAAAGSTSAHANANQILMSDLSSLAVPLEAVEISQAAAILLERNSIRLRELGALTTTGLFGKLK